jgi:hypothetical protein
VVHQEEFCKAKFGWEGAYTQQVLRPVLQAHRTRVVQTRIDQYSSFYKRAARIKSARGKKVVVELTRGLADPDMMADDDGLTTEFLEAETTVGGTDEERVQKGRKKRAGKGREAGKGTRKKGRKTKAEKEDHAKNADDKEGDSGEDGAGAGELEGDDEFRAALQVSMETSGEAEGPTRGKRERKSDEEAAAEEEDDELDGDADFQAALQLSRDRGSSDGGGKGHHSSLETEQEGGQAQQKRESRLGGKRSKPASAVPVDKRRRKKRRSGRGKGTRFVDESEESDLEDVGSVDDIPLDEGKEEKAAAAVAAEEEEQEEEEEEEDWELGDDYQAALAMSRAAGHKSGGGANAESDEDELQAALQLSLTS